ncbi:MAG: peptidylprolyl isomerase [Pseudomonadota bacterium]
MSTKRLEPPVTKALFALPAGPCETLGEDITLLFATRPASGVTTVKAIIAALVLTTSLTFSAFAQDADAVVAKVGDREITNADLDVAATALAQQVANAPEAERRARVLDSLIDIHVLAGKAKADGLADDAATKRRIDLLTNRALHNAYFDATIRSKITDEELQARYDTEVASVTPEKEVKARHILVETEEAAKAIITELDGGADFEALAKEKSTGPSGPQGGDLGFFGKGRMVPDFEVAAFRLEPGTYTKEPVKTQFGFHVIKVDEVRDVALPTFDQAKDQLRQIVLAEKYAEAIKSAREAAGVTINDESLKLPPVPAAE